MKTPVVTLAVSMAMILSGHLLGAGNGLGSQATLSADALKVQLGTCKTGKVQYSTCARDPKQCVTQYSQTQPPVPIGCGTPLPTWEAACLNETAEKSNGQPGDFEFTTVNCGGRYDQGFCKTEGLMCVQGPKAGDQGICGTKGWTK